MTFGVPLKPAKEQDPVQPILVLRKQSKVLREKALDKLEEQTPTEKGEALDKLEEKALTEKEE